MADLMDHAARYRVILFFNGLVVVAAHDLNAALPFSDAFMALRGGRLTARGPASGLDKETLKGLYGAKFLPYRSERGDVLWRALAE